MLLPRVQLKIAFAIRNGTLWQPGQEAHVAGDVDEQPRGGPTLRQRHPGPNHVVKDLSQYHTQRCNAGCESFVTMVLT